MPKMVVLTNHELTPQQVEQAKQVFGIDSFVTLPPELAPLWMAIPPQEEDVTGIAEKIIVWLENNTNRGDYMLVHGDFGIVFMIVDWGLRMNRVPVYSTTERKYEQKKDDQGNIVNIHVFKHVRFRPYRRYLA